MHTPLKQPSATVVATQHQRLHHEKGEVDVDKELDADWVDASRLEVFNLCPRKYFYRHELHLSPKGLPDSALSFGSAWHAALACWYMGEGALPATCPCPTFNGCEFCKGEPIPRMLMLFLLHYPFDPEDEKDLRTRSMGLRLLQAYLSKWQRETFEVIGTEVPFILPFYRSCTTCYGGGRGGGGSPCEVCAGSGQAVDFYYVGKIDLIVKEDGEVKPIDHKTTTRYGQIFDQQFKLSPQFTGYMRAIGTIMGVPVSQGKVNAARITTKIDEDSFLRLDTSRTQEDFDEWEREVKRAMGDIRSYRFNNFWPKRAPFACSAYFRTCAYYGLCTADAATRETLIANAFEKIEWSPIDE